MSILIDKNNDGDVQVTEDGNTQTLFPNINEQGGGSGGGAVSSVNGQTGAVVLDADDVGAVPTGAEDITEFVTLTPGTDCESVTLNNALKCGNIVGLRVTLAPSKALANNVGCLVNVSGVTALTPSVSTGGGNISGNGLTCYMASASEFKVVNIGSSNWAKSTNATIVIFFVCA